MTNNKNNDRKTSRPNIRRRGDTYTWFAYTTGGDGKRKQISRGGFRTIKEAELDRIAKLQDPGQGNYVTPAKTSVAEYLENEWLPNRRHDPADSTWDSYASKIRTHVLPHIGALPLQELTPADLNNLYRTLLDSQRTEPSTSRRHPPETIVRMEQLHNEGHTAASIAEALQAEGHPSAEGLTRHAVAATLRRRTRNRKDTVPQWQPLSPRSVQMVHQILSKALGDAMKLNRVYRNVAKAATAPKPATHYSHDSWTPEELQRFWAFIRTSRYYYPFAFAATCGGRRGEILGLRWSRIDLHKGTAIIDTQLTTDRKHTMVFKAGSKTGRAHLIYLDPATINLLGEWREQQRREKDLLADVYQDDDLVFCLEDGRPYHPERFSREFLRKQRQHNESNPDTPLPRLKLHGLRHTWATIALAEGVPLKVVSDRLGHANITITAQTYSHVTPPIARDASNVVGGLVLGS